MKVVWEEWKRRVTSAFEGSRTKKVVPAGAKSCWNDEVKAAIEERRRLSRSLRRAEEILYALRNLERGDIDVQRGEGDQFNESVVQ